MYIYYGFHFVKLYLSCFYKGATLSESEKNSVLPKLAVAANSAPGGVEERRRGTLLGPLYFFSEVSPPVEC
jgi:hypothetical protein